MSTNSIDPAPPAPRPDWFALAGVLVSIVLHIILDAEKPFLPFIVGCCLFWVGFIVWRVCQNPGVFREWGFRLDNLRRASHAAVGFFLLATFLLVVWGIYFGTLQFPPHLVWLLLLYPLWGFIQQFLALGIVMRTLEAVPLFQGRPMALAIGTSLIFGLVHLNDWRVAFATMALEGGFVLLYFRERNLIPLAVIHGWLGAFFYLWVLQVDLWRETFG